MNARIRARQRLSGKEQKELNEYIFKNAFEIYKNESMGLMRRCYKAIAVALNEQFGFGKSRLMKLYDKVKEIAIKRNEDEIYWKHIDDVVINQIGIDFEREDYKNLDE